MWWQATSTYNGNNGDDDSCEVLFGGDEIPNTSAGWFRNQEPQETRRLLGMYECFLKLVCGMKTIQSCMMRGGAC